MPNEVKAKDITDRRARRKVPSADRIAYANKLSSCTPGSARP